MTTESQQIERERDMAERGQRRTTTVINRAMERGDVIETPAGLNLARQAIRPLSEAIREFVKEAFSGKAVRRGHAANMLKGVDPELAAYFTIRATLSSASHRRTLKSAAMTLTEYLELELIADAFEKANEPLYRSVVRRAQNRGLPGPRIAKAVSLANRQFNVVARPWTQTQRLHLGSKLVELMIESTGLIHAALVREGRNRVTHRLELAPNVWEWLGKYNNAAALTRPMFLPTVVPPKPWDGIKGGAYYSPILRGGAIVTRYFPGQLQSLAEASMPAVYKGLNAVQETPWRINRRVLEVMQEVWDRNLPGFPLPAREDEPIPAATPEVIAEEKGGPLRKALRAQRREVHERNAKNRSLRFEFDRAVAMARENAEHEAIYFPHRLDFRGRAYASATSLNPQGPDEVRSLLEFSEGKPLGERGMFWLGVHGANLFGEDKVSLEERYRWALGYTQMAGLIAHDPFNYRAWTEADKPWCFLAWCFEWAEVAERLTPNYPTTAHEFVSHLPIALDGSCNGIQHYSAMLRDPVGGKAVNLVPGDKPQDIYREVAYTATCKLSDGMATPGPDQWIHDAWFQFELDRKITKRAVMVLPYGGTYASCRDYVRQAVRERLRAGQENPFGDELRRAENLLANLVWQSIGDVVVAARAGMTWLQQVAKVAAKAKVPLKWTTPSGFVVHQEYHELSHRRVKTRFMGQLIYFRTVDETEVIDVYRQGLAVAPNFVHSLDASAMLLTVGAGVDEGITSWAMVHDSYGTHAADTEKLATILRRTFVEMYEDHDVLQEFRDSIAAMLPPEIAAELPPVPAKGTLDLKEVLNSNYFFA